MVRIGAWFAALTLLTTWLYVGDAYAAEGPRWAGVERPRVAEAGAELLVEDVDLECVDAEREFIAAQMRCTGTFRWVIELPAATTELVFFGEAVEVERIEVDGKATELLEEPGELYDRWWPKPWLADEDDPALLRSRFVVPVHGGGKVTIELHATLHPRDLWVNHRELHLSAVRHMLVTKPRDDLRLFFAAPKGASGKSDELALAKDRSIRVAIPKRWRVNRRAWSVERDGGRRVLTSRDREPPVVLDMSKGEPLAGGPLAAAGVSIQHGGDVRPRLRVGYELGSLPFLVHTLAVESDLRRVEVVASTDIGTQNIFVVFPSLSAGVGVPLRVHPTVRPGVRAQAALGWPFVSLIGTFDVFPALGAGDLELFGGVMLQLNL